MCANVQAVAAKQDEQLPVARIPELQVYKIYSKTFATRIFAATDSFAVSCWLCSVTHCSGWSCACVAAVYLHFWYT